MEHFIGIDLGTTYSAVSTIDEYGKPVVIKNVEGDYLTPSVVYISPNGKCIAGVDAKDMSTSGDDNVFMFFKREMGNSDFCITLYDKQYTATDFSTILLKKLKSDAEIALGAKVTKAVITVPAYFNDLQRNETIKAAQNAGLEVLRIINEPTAAAINYGITRDLDQKLLVYDLGGGTFDVTVLEVKNGAINILATGGDHALGGKDWDDCILNYIAQQFEFEFGENPLDDPATFNDLEYNVENLKKQLSSLQTASMIVRYAGNKQKYNLTRDKFEELSANLLYQTTQKTEQVLQEAGLSWNSLSGVLLVGGSTKMPMVEKWVQKMSGKAPLRGINVDEAVCLGAAIQASLEMENQNVRRGLPQGSCRKFSLPSGKNIQINDVMSHSLGAVAVSQDGNCYVNSIIIRKNRTIPISESRSFKHKTRADSDNEMEVYLTQGENTEIQDCIVVGRYMIKDIEHVNGGDSIIDLQYSYDENGIINIKGYQQETRKCLVPEKLPLPDDMSWLYGKPKGKVFMNIILAIDTSGSMGLQGRMDSAKNAAFEFVDKLNLESTSVSIIGFSEDVKEYCSLSKDIMVIKNAIGKMSAVGGTESPLKYCYNKLKDSKDKSIIVLLTDGEWSGQWKAIFTSDKCKAAGIDIIGIGIGDADEKFLRRISSISVMTDLDNLVGSFSTIAQELTQSGNADKLKLNN